MNDMEQAQAVYREQLACAREALMPTMEVAALNHLATLAAQDYSQRDRARGLLQEAQKRAQESDDRIGLAKTEWNLAQVSYYAFDMQSALHHGTNALRWAENLQLPELQAQCLNTLAHSKRSLILWPEAAKDAEQARSLYATLKNRAMEADCLGILADLEVSDGLLLKGYNRTAMQAFCRLARRAPIGLIVRRGPTRWVQLILWHIDTDEIEYGQWFHGNIPSYWCDLSPDGSLFIYFASKYGRSPFDTWTAISRPPYFTALALWPLGDSWSGGGMFVDEKTILLNYYPIIAPTHEVRLPPPWLKVNTYPGGMSLSNRCLIRDGWTEVQKGVQSPDHKSLTLLEPEIFQKRHPDGRHILLMKYLGDAPKRYGSPYIYEFSLKNTTRRHEMVLEGITWADLDHRQRLVFTKNDGCLYADELRLTEFSPQLLANLNDQRPKNVSTPEWATTWEQRANQA